MGRLGLFIFHRYDALVYAHCTNTPYRFSPFYFESSKYALIFHHRPLFFFLCNNNLYISMTSLRVANNLEKGAPINKTVQNDRDSYFHAVSFTNMQVCVRNRKSVFICHSWTRPIVNPFPPPTPPPSLPKNPLKWPIIFLHDLQNFTRNRYMKSSSSFLMKFRLVNF